MTIYTDPPSHCNICKQEIGDVLFDIKTKFGPWANTCAKCAIIYGIGLGIGLGQKYVKNDKGELESAYSEKSE